MHRCLDEQQVVRLAAGLVSAGEAEALLFGVETCEACRSLLLEAGVALHGSTAAGFGVFREAERIANRYEVQRLLGRGGMGEVYEVFDLELQERAALKTIRPELSDDPHVVSRFKQELRLARKVIHPNVCRVFDLGVYALGSGRHFYFHTMEFIQGRPLSEFRNQALPLSRVLAIARQLAAGLAAIHAHAIVHRDLKPENVLVSSETDGSPRCVILDFGIARSRDRLSTLETTGSGIRLGTPDYMAPEALKSGTATPASDVFSFGLVVYELLTSRHPCPNAGTRAALAALDELGVVSPTLLRKEVPELLSELLLLCLRADPVQRPKSGAELVRALNRLRDALGEGL